MTIKYKLKNIISCSTCSGKNIFGTMSPTCVLRFCDYHGYPITTEKACVAWSVSNSSYIR